MMTYNVDETKEVIKLQVKISFPNDNSHTIWMKCYMSKVKKFSQKMEYILANKKNACDRAKDVNSDVKKNTPITYKLK